MQSRRMKLYQMFSSSNKWNGPEFWHQKLRQPNKLQMYPIYLSSTTSAIGRTWTLEEKEPDFPSPSNGDKVLRKKYIYA